MTADEPFLGFCRVSRVLVLDVASRSGVEVSLDVVAGASAQPRRDVSVGTQAAGDHGTVT